MPLWKKSKPSVPPPVASVTFDMWGRDPSKFIREVAPEFVIGEGGIRARPDKYITTMCHVCHLQLFPETEVRGFYPAAMYKTNTQFMTKGGLSLCQRHYNLVNDLTQRQIPVDKWPSQLIRGIITLSKEWLQASSEGLTHAQKRLGEIQTTRTVITPAPVFGNSYNPVTPFGGTGTFSDYFFVFPMQRQVVDQNAVNEVTFNQNVVQLQEQRITHYSQQLSKYSELLARLKKENPPKFKTCIRCGQSEIPLSANSCTWCGKSQSFSGDVAPVPILVEDVDPLNVVPVYRDRVGIEVLSSAVNKNPVGVAEVRGKKEDELKSRSNGDVFCTHCGTKLTNPSSKFCDHCGSSIETVTASKSIKNQEIKTSSRAPQPIKSSGGRVPLPATATPITTAKGSQGSLKEEKVNGDKSSSTPGNSLKTFTTSEPIKFCPECGKKLPFERTKYCPYCGTKIPAVN